MENLGELTAPARTQGCRVKTLNLAIAPGRNRQAAGWDTKMEKLSYGGIDVSKDRLDVVVLPEGWFFSVSNDTAGWTELVARLRPLAVCAIGLEPSGGYERASSAPCSRPDCRCDVSTPTSFVSSLAPAASWPRMIASMRD